ncbi:MAG: chromosomal replication initiator protein DnaA [bacterium]|nr:chromosomal replication initiator protein DnaA [bacterium]
MDDLWRAILAELETEISPASFRIWFLNTKQHNLQKTNGLIRLWVSCPSGFVQDTIKSRFLSQIKKIGGRVAGKPVEVEFEISGSTPKAKPQNLSLMSFEKSRDRNSLNPQYTFENFVVGPSNQVAVAAAMAITHNPGGVYNPFFLFGGVGLGKTHLIQAIAHEMKKQKPKLKILYTSSEEFTNDLIGALRRQKMDKYKNKYRRVDVLLIDDIQFIAGKTFVQEEFFHTFNSLYMNNKQVIVTADSPPDEIDGLPQRIISRFKGGLAIDVQALDYETRRGIVEKKMAERSLGGNGELVEMLASHPFENAREIEGVILKLETLNHLQKKELTPDLVQSILGEGGAVRKTHDPKKILKTVSRFFGVPVKDIKGQGRQSKIAMARHVAVFLCRSELNLPFVAIGRLFGGRDHSTIIHSVEKVEKMFKTKKEIRQAIISIKGELNR